jgi:hypothetical protein
MSSDDELMVVLELIQGGEESGVLHNNGSLASALGWSPQAVADLLAGAKQRSLIWGMRGGAKPQPWFNDLELTVQGRRVLSPRPTA